MIDKSVVLTALLKFLNATDLRKLNGELTEAEARTRKESAQAVANFLLEGKDDE